MRVAKRVTIVVRHALQKSLLMMHLMSMVTLSSVHWQLAARAPTPIHARVAKLVDSAQL